jgi:pimeloyl-ACP methyl ester carboxylesterase
MTIPRVHRFAGRDGLELAYRETGEGRSLILLHGFAATARQWLEHGPAAALAAQGTASSSPICAATATAPGRTTRPATRPMSWPMTGSR